MESLEAMFFMPHSIHTHFDWNRTPRPSHEPVRFIHISSYIKHTQGKETHVRHEESESEMWWLVVRSHRDWITSIRFDTEWGTVWLSVLLWCSDFVKFQFDCHCRSVCKRLEIVLGLLFFVPQISILSISEFGLCGLEHFSAFFAFHSFGGGERKIREISHADRVFGGRCREAKRWKQSASQKRRRRKSGEEEVRRRSETADTASSSQHTSNSTANRRWWRMRYQLAVIHVSNRKKQLSQWNYR